MTGGTTPVGSGQLYHKISPKSKPKARTRYLAPPDLPTNAGRGPGSPRRAPRSSRGQQRSQLRRKDTGPCSPSALAVNTLPGSPALLPPHPSAPGSFHHLTSVCPRLPCSPWTVSQTRGSHLDTVQPRASAGFTTVWMAAQPSPFPEIPHYGAPCFSPAEPALPLAFGKGSQ